MNSQNIPSWKRAIDLLAAAGGLLLVAPLLAVSGLLIKLESQGPMFFQQERVGRHFRRFKVLKLRTMVADASSRGGELTCGADPRVTRVGRILRKTKIDELPQLVNVLRGEMSLVGPRPEVPRYVELFKSEYEEILRVQPGMTDLASIQYVDESSILQRAEDPEREYVTTVLPEKIALAKQYMARSSLRFDLSLIVRTLLKIVTR